MRQRINLLALAVILGGAGVLARPAPLRATYYDEEDELFGYCCKSATQKCCSRIGCQVTPDGCVRMT